MQRTDEITLANKDNSLFQRAVAAAFGLVSHPTFELLLLRVTRSMTRACGETGPTQQAYGAMVVGGS